MKGIKDTGVGKRNTRKRIAGEWQQEKKKLKRRKQCCESGRFLTGSGSYF
jgi:hypothetical protein